MCRGQWTRGDDVGISRRVAGKVAFIPGAARGQGRQHAIRLAEEGADIIAVDVCSDIEGAPYPLATKAAFDETAALVEKLDRRVVAAKADVGDLDGLRGRAATRSRRARAAPTS